MIFHTGLCLLNAATGRAHSRGFPLKSRFRELSDAEIHRYLDKEDALNCAGSARSEGLGIACSHICAATTPTPWSGCR